MRPQALTCTLLLTSLFASAQVDAIKRKSSENSGRRSEGGRSGSSSSGSAYFFIDLFRLVGEAQRMKLQKADSIKRIISLESFFQGAIQPSTYYLFNPRIRGNWGLFSTDFRMNYLVEEKTDSVTHDLTTLDWQIIQLNLITTRNFTARVGAGNLYERFGSKQSFFEWTTGISFYSNSQTIVANMEYRVAKDFLTNDIPRREINFSLEKQIFNAGGLRGYATLGGVYQRYYQSVSVWGLQTGLVIRIF
jgi:hypothetical protein